MYAWRLLCTKGPLAGKQWVLPADEPTLIGRAPGNQITIPDAVLSRHHSRIQFRDGKPLLEDLGSRNGTQLNGRRIGVPTEIGQGDRVEIGEHEFVLLTPAGEALPDDVQARATNPSLRQYVHLPSRTVRDAADSPPAPWRVGLAGLPGDPFSRSFLQLGPARIEWKRTLFYGIVGLSIALSLTVFAMKFFRPAFALQGEALTVGVGMALVSFGWLPLLYLVNRTGKNSPFLLLLLVIWGATVAISMAMLAGRFLLAGPSAGLPFPLRLFSFTAGPVVEEAVKAVVLVLFMACRYDEYTNSIDGVVLGMAVGLGFAFGENMLYFTRAAANGGETLLSLFMARSPLLPTVCHPAWSALVGYGLGLYRERKTSRRRWLYPLGGFLLAVACHALWNFLGYSFQKLFHRLMMTFALLLLTIGLLVILVLIILCWWALQKERTILVRYLAPLLDSRVLSSEEFLDLLSPARFYRGLARTLQREGWRVFRLRLRLYREQLQLAYRKWHLDTGDRFKGIHFDRLEMAILERIVQTKRGLSIPSSPTPS